MTDMVRRSGPDDEGFLFVSGNILVSANGFIKPETPGYFDKIVVGRISFAHPY